MENHNEKAIAFRKQLDNARNKYKPSNINLLFVAEAPPENTNRFFYYEQVRDHDWLYLAIIKALCNGCCDVSRMRSNKKSILKYLQQDGIFLMDLCPVPLNMSENLYVCVNDFMQRLEEEDAVNKSKTNIILIKTNVYDCLFYVLKDKNYLVSDRRIPFPASGQQKKFAEEMRKALEIIHYVPKEGVEKIKKLVM